MYAVQTMHKSGAMIAYGLSFTVDEVFRDVMKDACYYKTSGGGVTASGGGRGGGPDAGRVCC